jgi:hypothetical protein
VDISNHAICNLSTVDLPIYRISLSIHHFSDGYMSNSTKHGRRNMKLFQLSIPRKYSSKIKSSKIFYIHCSKRESSVHEVVFITLGGKLDFVVLGQGSETLPSSLPRRDRRSFVSFIYVDRVPFHQLLF